MGCIMKFRSPNLYMIIIVTKIKKDFLKKKKSKRFLYFLYFFANEVVIRLQSFVIIGILDNVNMVLLFFQFELEMAVHTACTKRKFIKLTTFDTF